MKKVFWTNRFLGVWGDLFRTKIDFCVEIGNVILRLYPQCMRLCLRTTKNQFFKWKFRIRQETILLGKNWFFAKKRFFHALREHYVQSSLGCSSLTKLMCWISSTIMFDPTVSLVLCFSTENGVRPTAESSVMLGEIQHRGSNTKDASSATT